MKDIIKRVLILLLVAAMVLGIILPAVYATRVATATILFTHDLHSHLLPAEKEGGGQYGGYARLMTEIRKQREMYPDAILVDGGDFSMGSLFQTAYPTSAIELRMMGAMGFDATTFGNHEFDYLPKGLASMLNVAAEYDTPAIVNANYLPPREGEEGFTSDSALVQEAFDNYGVEDFILLERGGFVYAIFGLFGYDADACAPNSGMILEDPAVAAQRVVDKVKAVCQDQYGVDPIVIALSHSGTSGGKGEDYELAEKVNGIDVIISGHTHSTHKEPIEVNNTWIVSGGEYGKNLGVIQLARDLGGGTRIVSYELIPIDETVEEDPEIAALVESFKADVEKNYLAAYGMTFDQVLTNNPYAFETVKQVKATSHESTLGNLFSDAYKWAVEEATRERVDLALTAAGVLRESVPLGDVTVSDIFNAASLGVGTEGELIAIYVTGSDLRNIIEVDASVQPLMKSAQLYCSGVEFTANLNRMIFNKVDYLMLRRENGVLEEIDPDKLYRVVTGMYAGQMLGNVEATSFGLLTITPRDKDGNPVDVADLVNYVVRDENGVPVKEWYAIASYLDRMGGEMDARYETTDGRKVLYKSWNPVDLLRNANHFTWIALGVICLTAIVLAVTVRGILRFAKKHRK